MTLRYGQRGHCSREPGVDPAEGDPDVARIVAEAAQKRPADSGLDDGANSRRRIVSRRGSLPMDKYFDEANGVADSAGEVLGTQLLARDFSVLSSSLGRYLKGIDDSVVSGAVGEIKTLVLGLSRALNTPRPGFISSNSGVLTGRALWGGVFNGTGINIATDSTELGVLLREIHAKALLASRLMIPNDSAAFRAWLSRAFGSGSLREKIVGVMGGELAGTGFKSRRLQAGVDREVSLGIINTALMQMRGYVKRVESGMFDLDVEGSGDGAAVLHSLVPLMVAYKTDGSSDELAKVKAWGDRFFTPGRGARGRGIFDFISSRSLGTMFKFADFAKFVFGKDKFDHDFVNKYISSPLSQFVLRIEADFNERLAAERDKADRSPIECFKKLAKDDFTLRRMRDKRGADTRVDVVLENRLVAMEKWISEMAFPNTPLEKVLWEMFQRGLGKEVFVGDLAKATNMSEEWVRCAVENGSKDGKNLFEKSKNTMFQVVSRDDGATYSILP